jgi:hypothetical protein
MVFISIHLIIGNANEKHSFSEAKTANFFDDSTG